MNFIKVKWGVKKMKKLEDIVLKEGDIVEFDDGEFWYISGSDGETADKFLQVKSIKRASKFKTIYKKN